MNRTKRLLATLLALALLVCTLPLATFADAGDPPIHFTVDKVTSRGAGAFNVHVNYASDKDFATIRAYITFDSDVLIADLPESEDDQDKLMQIGSGEGDVDHKVGTFNADDGKLVAVAIDCHGSLNKTGSFITLPFRLAAGANPADAKITITVKEMKDAKDVTATYDYIKEFGEPLTVELPFTVSGTSATLGDVNSDGKVDSGDALQLLRYAAEIITSDDINMTVADLNGDGKVDSGDALLSLQYAAEIIHEFPASK